MKYLAILLLISNMSFARPPCESLFFRSSLITLETVNEILQISKSTFDRIPLVKMALMKSPILKEKLSDGAATIIAIRTLRLLDKNLGAQLETDYLGSLVRRSLIQFEIEKIIEEVTFYKVE